MVLDAANVFADFLQGFQSTLLHTSGDIKAVLTVHHAPVDPQAVPSLHLAQSAVTHLTLQTDGGLTGF